MVFYQVLGAPMLIISSTRAAYDLLEKRSAAYSDRPLSKIDQLYDYIFQMMIHIITFTSIQNRVGLEHWIHAIRPALAKHTAAGTRTI